MGIEKILHTGTDIVRAVAGVEKYKPTAAVILAAGSSERMRGQNKQLALLDGIPVLARTLIAFQNAPCIAEIVVVAAAADIPEVNGLCEKHRIKKLTAVTVGGDTRQKSAFEGLLKISDKMKYVAIHDGARCLITTDMIVGVCREAYINGAAAAATPCVDSIKKIAGNRFVAEGVERKKLWAVQTPQVFLADLYRAAAYTARNDGFAATDDCSLAEHIQYNNVKLVDCGRSNIKITEPDDLELAAALLEIRKRKAAWDI